MTVLPADPFVDAMTRMTEWLVTANQSKSFLDDHMTRRLGRYIKTPYIIDREPAEEVIDTMIKCLQPLYTCITEAKQTEETTATTSMDLESVHSEMLWWFNKVCAYDEKFGPAGQDMLKIPCVGDTLARSTIQERDEEIERLKEEIERLKEEIERKSSQVVDLRCFLEKYEEAWFKDSQDAEEAKCALTAERDALTAERDALKAEMSKLKTERDALKAEMSKLKAERDALKAERDALKAERDALTVKLEKAEDDNVLLEKLAFNQNRTIRFHQDKLEKERAEYAERIQNISEATKINSKRAREEGREEVDELKAQLKQAKIEAEKAQAQVKAELEHAKAETASLKTRLTHAENTREVALKQGAILRNAMNQMRKHQNIALTASRRDPCI